MAREAGSRVELRPTRRHLYVTAPDARVDPAWPITWTDDGPFYARPADGGLMLCACDEVDVDPDALCTVPAVRELALEQAARHLRDAVAPVARAWAGIRTLTDDGRFVIGADPDVGGLFWVAGLGGHGMTCAPSIGRLAADALLDEPGAQPAARALAPARFRARVQGAQARGASA
jgi:glycine/D-amino acid oxidase-like deaminating enzyme